MKITPLQPEAIVNMPYPLDSEGDVDETRLRSFIGLANFSRQYTNNFAMHAYRLNGLLRKESTSVGIWALAHVRTLDGPSRKRMRHARIGIVGGDRYHRTVSVLF